MEAEIEVKDSTTPPPTTSITPPADIDQSADVTVIQTKQKRSSSLRRDGPRKGSLRRDQRTGEKRRSRTGSLGSLVGYEAKYPVSIYMNDMP